MHLAQRLLRQKPRPGQNRFGDRDDGDVVDGDPDGHQFQQAGHPGDGGYEIGSGHLTDRVPDEPRSPAVSRGSHDPGWPKASAPEADIAFDSPRGRRYDTPTPCQSATKVLPG